MVHDFSLIDHLSAERSEKEFTLRHELFPKCTRRNGCLSVVFNDDFSHPLHREWSIFYGGQWMDGRWRKVFLCACGLEKNKKKFVKNLDEEFFNGSQVFLHSIRVNFIICHVWRNATEIGFSWRLFILPLIHPRHYKLPANYVACKSCRIYWIHPHLKLHHVDEPENEDGDGFPYTLRFNLRRWKCLLN